MAEIHVDSYNFVDETTKDKLDKKKASKIEERYCYARSSKTEISQKWKKFLRLYEGKHWDKQRAKWKTEAVYNMCFSLVEAMVPLMTDRMPTIYCEPQEPNDVAKAEMLNHVISYIWNADNVQEKLSRVVRDQLVLGVGIMKVGWDTEKYRGDGDVTVSVVDPFDFFPDPSALTPDAMQWCIFKTVEPTYKLRLRYPDKKQYIKSNSQYFNEDQTRDFLGKQSVKNDGLSDVYEYWYYDEQTGKIMVCISSNGVILDEKENPFEFERFPFVFFYDYVTTNSGMWGMSEYENLAPLQMELNKIRAVIMDNLISMQSAMWLVPKQSGIKKGGITNEPGQIVEYNGNAKPERVMPGQMPAFIPAQQEMTKQAMEEISGVHNISKGQMEGQLSSAAAIQAITENSQTKIREKVRSMEYAIKRLGEFFVSIVSQMYTEPRLIRMNADDNKYKFDWFNALDLRQPDPTKLDENGQIPVDPQTGRPLYELVSQFDVQVKGGSSMKLNKQAKYQQALEMLNAGTLDIETFLNISEIGDTQKILANLVKYGVIKDPNAPKVDARQLLDQIGLKFNVTSNEPVVVRDAIDKLFAMVDQANSTDSQAQAAAADPQGQWRMPQNQLNQQIADISQMQGLLHK